jgi:hypothetical protein
VLLRLPVELVPFTVSVNVPRLENLVPTDMLVVPDVVTEVGENATDAPLGSPDTLKFTLPVYPFFGLRVTA